jgi:hypothetical protein
MPDSRTTAPDASQARTVCDLLEQQVRIRPHATAIRTPTLTWTFSELDAVTTRLGHRLARAPGMPRPHRPSPPCDVVDPEDPPLRNQQIIGEADVRCPCRHPHRVVPRRQLIGDASCITRTPTGNAASSAPIDLAYAITTSGSPPGAAVPHDAPPDRGVDDLALVARSARRAVAVPAHGRQMQDCLMALCRLCHSSNGISSPAASRPSARTLGATVVDIPAAVIGLWRAAACNARVRLVRAIRLEAPASLCHGSLVVLNAREAHRDHRHRTLYRCNDLPRWVPIGRPPRVGTQSSMAI